ncbi:MAG TPA: DegV family protein [Jatrophihabitantaceae bacterium]|nr:DegV family protein [Jatrophihabitantaceae bacterium]
MSRVAIVTDSTAYLPDDCADVRVVPLRVHLGSRTAVDGVDVTPADVVTALRAKVAVSTSRPSPAEFAAAYRSALDEGADHVVSIHLAAALSGTWESAVLASQDFGYGVVRVVDSRGTAAGLGFAVRAAARSAAAGASAAEVQQAATSVVDRTRTLFYVDTLEYLRRGGRIGTAAALFATSLSVKPLLQMVEGQIVALEKVRTPTRALARLVALTVEAAGRDQVDLAVHHLAAEARANTVADQLRSELPSIGELSVAELGPVLGAHLGPGVIGTILVRH